MKLGWLVFFFICAVATAMVPKMKRSQPTEGESHVEICARTTPCAWSIYNPHVKRVEINLTNTYCTCKVGTTCQVYEDDTGASTYVFRCMKPES